MVSEHKKSNQNISQIHRNIFVLNSLTHKYSSTVVATYHVYASKLQFPNAFLYECFVRQVNCIYNYSYTSLASHSLIFSSNFVFFSK